MSQPLVLKYLNTRMHIEGRSHPFLRSIYRIAEAHSGHQPPASHIQGATALLDAMTAHLGSAVMLGRFQASVALELDSFLHSSTATNRAAVSIAVAFGNLSQVIKLLDEGADPNHGSAEFGLPLSIAVNTSQLQMVQMLLRRGADIYIQERSSQREGMSPRLALHGAALAGNEPILRHLLDHRRHAISCGMEYERAIYYAAVGGHEQVVWHLITKGTFSGLVRVKSLILLEGARAGQAGIVRMLLNHGVDPNFSEEGRHALHWSSFRGHVRITQMLLEYGADVNVCDWYYKSTPLVLASVNGHVDVMKLLLQSGCAPDVEMWNECARQAVREGHLGTMRFCLESGADLSAEDCIDLSGNLGHVLLSIACRESHLDVVHCLVMEYGIDPNGIGAPTAGMGSPMLIAVGKGDERLVQVLLGLGAPTLDLDPARLSHYLSEISLPPASSSSVFRGHSFWSDYLISRARPNFFAPSIKWAGPLSF